MTYRFAADIGGTFTDVALVDGDGRLRTYKLPSTPEDYAQAVLDGLARLAGSAGIVVAQLDKVLHTCTIATNAILENRGARTALVTTKGFRDVLELRRIRVPRLYEPLYEKPRPLVPRRWRLEVNERIGSRGEVIAAIDSDSVGRVIETLRREAVEAIAVCFINSHMNPVHERALGARLAATFPDCFISLSCDVLPQIRAYERTSTTVINAYVGPPVRRYLNSLSTRLREAGTDARLQVMRSVGGLGDVDSIINTPAHILECGPAAGVIGAARHGQRCGFSRLLTLDMGGTTAKASLVESGRVQRAED